ncbi:hypothetical protein BC830DRAFT_1102159 [Chytriomyces sp. MP71]|nr:hypothetical protein BC830DRAFT_1102159 [Chytriomyces sp. MP71]
MNLFQDLLTATFELGYIKYSWTRSSAIIAGRVRPISIRFITVFVKFCPLLLYAQALPAFFDVLAACYAPLHPYLATISILEQILSALAGASVLFFDIYLLVGFARQIRTLDKEMTDVGMAEDSTSRGAIIVRYGVASCCLWICAVVVYAGTTLVQQFSFEWYLISVFIYLLSLGTVVVLYYMKVALHVLDGKERMVFVSYATANTLERECATHSATL